MSESFQNPCTRYCFPNVIQKFTFKKIIHYNFGEHIKETLYDKNPIVRKLKDSLQTKSKYLRILSFTMKIRSEYIKNTQHRNSQKCLPFISISVEKKNHHASETVLQGCGSNCNVQDGKAGLEAVWLINYMIQ